MIVYGDKEICIYPAQKIMKVLEKEYSLLIIGLLGNKDSHDRVWPYWRHMR